MRVVRNIPQRIFNILTPVITPVACLVSDWCLTRNPAGMECTGLPICRILFGKTLVCALFGTRQNRTQHVATLLRDRWLARILKLTCGGCQTTARPSQVQSSQIKSSQVKSNQVESSRVESSRIKSNQVESGHYKASQIKSIQTKSSQARAPMATPCGRTNCHRLLPQIVQTQALSAPTKQGCVLQHFASSPTVSTSQTPQSL